MMAKREKVCLIKSGVKRENPCTCTLWTSRAAYYFHASLNGKCLMIVIFGYLLMMSCDEKALLLMPASSIAK